MDAALHESSIQTTICGNESNVDTCYRPIMRKLLHEAPSSVTWSAIDEYSWIINKMMNHPKHHTNTDALTLTENPCLPRVLIEVERRCFRRKEDATFSEYGKDSYMSLSDRKRGIFCYLKLEPVAV